MIRIALAATTLGLLVLSNACARESGYATTTVTSSDTQGLRVTNARMSDEPSNRLADEICERELVCNRIGPNGRYHALEGCMAEQSAIAPPQIARWGCVPTGTQAGFERCLAAIRSQKCETALSNVDVLEACRGDSVCVANRD